MENVMASVVSGSASNNLGKASGSFNLREAVFNTKFGLASLAALSVFVISITFEPPFVCVKNPDPIQSDELSYYRSSAMAAFAGLIVLTVPRFVKK
jgi:hypothetical protein